jgi:signal transduction histidine kinase
MASGSGLGLPIAREIVAGHHGSIAIISGADGKGTCMQVRLPVKPAITPAAYHAAPPPASPR